MSARGEPDAAQPTGPVVLRLILVSGKTHEFTFDSKTSAHDVIQIVFNQWPDEWYEDRVQSDQMLKLIYHGRFLHGSVTLHALQLQPGKTTVMHLVTRENLPEPNSSETLAKRKSAGCCRCVLS